jgi:hypothetical protein
LLLLLLIRLRLLLLWRFLMQRQPWLLKQTQL